MTLPFRFEVEKLLSQYSTFGVGGPARFFLEVAKIDQMQALLAYCYQQQLPYIVIGKGSNCGGDYNARVWKVGWMAFGFLVGALLSFLGFIFMLFIYPDRRPSFAVGVFVGAALTAFTILAAGMAGEFFPL